MAEEAGWGAWVRMMPSPGETFVGKLGHSAGNPGREGMTGAWEATWQLLAERWDKGGKGTSILILPSLG